MNLPEFKRCQWTEQQDFLLPKTALATVSARD
jgi:hypothetical protein